MILDAIASVRYLYFSKLDRAVKITQIIVFTIMMHATAAYGKD